MGSLIKFLPLKWKRRVNKQLRRVGLAAPVQKRVRKVRSVANDTPLVRGRTVPNE